MSELIWDSPSPSKKKKIDGLVNRYKKPKVAQKEPRKSHAKQLVESKPRTKILDSENCFENIMQGSPTYIPYKKVPQNKQGHDNFRKKIIFPTFSSSEMPHQK